VFSVLADFRVVSVIFAFVFCGDQSTGHVGTKNCGDEVQNEQDEAGSDVQKTQKEQNQPEMNTVVQSSQNHEVDDDNPVDLHGDWIKVEREKKNPKINGQNSQKGMFNNLHKSKFIGSNGDVKVKAHGSNMNNGYHNTSHSFVKKKTKRQRNENNMPKINDLDGTEHISTPSNGKNKGSYTIIKEHNTTNSCMGMGTKLTPKQVGMCTKVDLIIK
jgi:hypothetical protein